MLHQVCIYIHMHMLHQVWDLNTMRCRHTLKGHSSRVRALAISGNLLFSGSNDKSIKVRHVCMHVHICTYMCVCLCMRGYEHALAMHA